MASFLSPSYWLERNAMRISFFGSACVKTCCRYGVQVVSMSPADSIGIVDPMQFLVADVFCTMPMCVHAKYVFAQRCLPKGHAQIV